nr:hypothetical protein GCM10020063_036260 [Dactylosporangium thailandense]
MPVGRRHHLILDCPDPAADARFWSAVLGDPITHDDGDFVVVSPDTATSGLAFQRVPDHRRPTWPGPAVPQQMHLDVMVDDLAGAAAAVVALGATAARRPRVRRSGRPPLLPDPPPDLGPARGLAPSASRRSASACQRSTPPLVAGVAPRVGRAAKRVVLGVADVAVPTRS